LDKRKPLQRTTLTSRQWEVISYRAKGLTQAQLAKKLRTSRENVNEIEHRARVKIDAAKGTLAALQHLDATSEVLIPSGTSIFEGVSMIYLRADILGIRLRCSADEVLAAIRSRWRGRIVEHRLTSAVKVEIDSHGILLAKNPSSPDQVLVRSNRRRTRQP
jgi:HTH-type transcriptional regulator, fmd operon transcriptional regulator